MSTFFARNRLFVLTAALVIAFDWVTKHWIRTNVPLNSAILEDWPIQITHVANTGAAFGMFQDRSTFFMIIAIIAVALILYYYRRLPASVWPVRLALGLQLGGAVGNLMDRIQLGHVTDFIDLRWWPVFNIADSSIVVGVIILGYYLLFVARDESAPQQAPASD